MTDSNISGILCIDKPAGMTSHDVVNRIRRLYGTRKVGHTGTLDPMATGVLVILIGRAAKLSDYLLADRKTYEAGLLLGCETDTQDTTGKIVSQSDDIPDLSVVEAACATFVGRSVQTPPMYSAKKVNGVKLYELARDGIEIERCGCEIEIYSLGVKKRSDREYNLSVSCSKGTYIRTLCHDIGKALGCGGCMSSLRRTKNGAFSIDGAVSIEKLEALSESERAKLLITVEAALSYLQKIALPPFFARLAHNGCEIYQSKIGTSLPEGTMVRLYDGDSFFALGEVRRFGDKTAVKPIKSF